MSRNRRTLPHGEDHKRHFFLIEWLIRRATRILWMIFNQREQGRLHVGLHITVTGGTKMPNIPVALNSKEKVFITINPIKPDGTEDPDVDVAFSSSDPSVGIEEQPDGRSAFILTPGESGSAAITVSAPGYAEQIVDVTYSPLVLGNLNVSVGQPQSDL